MTLISVRGLACLATLFAISHSVESDQAAKRPELISFAIKELKYHRVSRLAVDSRGNGYWSMSGVWSGTTFESVASRFQVDTVRVEELRKLLVTTKFFQLKSEYGPFLPDGGEFRIWIRQGEREKTVIISRVNLKRKVEASGAMEVWSLIRELGPREVEPVVANSAGN